MRRRRDGTAAVEFALTLPILILLFAGVVELCLLMHRVQLLSRVARDACRIGSGVIEGADPTGDEIEATATEHALAVLEQQNIPCDAGCRVAAEWLRRGDWMMLQVEVEVPYQPVTGFLPSIAPSTSGSFVMLTQQQVQDDDDAS